MNVLAAATTTTTTRHGRGWLALAALVVVSLLARPAVAQDQASGDFRVTHGGAIDVGGQQRAYVLQGIGGSATLRIAGSGGTPVVILDAADVGEGGGRAGVVAFALPNGSATFTVNGRDPGAVPPARAVNAMPRVHATTTASGVDVRNVGGTVTVAIVSRGGTTADDRGDKARDLFGYIIPPNRSRSIPVPPGGSVTLVQPSGDAMLVAWQAVAAFEGAPAEPPPASEGFYGDGLGWNYLPVKARAITPHVKYLTADGLDLRGIETDVVIKASDIFTEPPIPPAADGDLVFTLGILEKEFRLKGTGIELDLGRFRVALEYARGEFKGRGVLNGSHRWTHCEPVYEGGVGDDAVPVDPAGCAEYSIDFSNYPVDIKGRIEILKLGFYWPLATLGAGPLSLSLGPQAEFVWAKEKITKVSPSEPGVGFPIHVGNSSVSEFGYTTGVNLGAQLSLGGGTLLMSVNLNRQWWFGDFGADPVDEATAGLTFLF